MSEILWKFVSRQFEQWTIRFRCLHQKKIDNVYLYNFIVVNPSNRIDKHFYRLMYQSNKIWIISYEKIKFKDKNIMVIENSRNNEYHALSLWKSLYVLTYVKYHH